MPASWLPFSSTGEDIDLTAPSRAGTYYYGACIASVTNESDTTNNCSAAVSLRVTRPDLIVEDVGVDNSTPSPGGSFRLSVTVRNQGPSAGGRSLPPLTVLRYYRSTNSRITTGDTQVGTDSVSELSADQTDEQSIDLTAPSPGTYYYGACIDSVTDESDTNNNCSAAVKVVVPGPDLIVEDVSVNDSTPSTGGSFELSVTVRNQGLLAGGRLFLPLTVLRYYHSTDSTITTGDTPVGMDTVGLLPARGLLLSSTGEDIDLTAPSRAGTYYYGACIDSVTNERDTTNNCSAAVSLRVTRPDLIVEDVGVDNSTPSPGGSFRLSVTVRNQGPSAGGRLLPPLTVLRYYRSTNSRITTGDTRVGTDSVSRLSAGRTDDKSIDLTAPNSAGTYYYGACVDSVIDESDTNNNCSAAVRLVVNVPDLIVEGASVDDSTPSPGGSFELSVTVRNQGLSAGGRLLPPLTVLRYYRRSTNSRITRVGTDRVGLLPARGLPFSSTGEDIDLTAPRRAGTYYYSACIDSVTNESDTTNNCSAAVRVDVPSNPDLIVEDASVDDSTLSPGGSFRLSVTVRNQGNEQSGRTTLRYYRSSDSGISARYTQVGTDSVSGLSADRTDNESIDLTAPDSVGTYYYGACIDSVTNESDTNNNCSAAVSLRVTRPDLIVEDVSVDNSTLSSGDSFELSVTVRNQGPSAGGRLLPPLTVLRYYRSTNSRITTGDTRVGTDSVSRLSAGRTDDKSIDLTAPNSAGTYYYGACVDSVIDESDTNNNCSAAVRLVVNVPDLIVEGASVDDSTPSPGGSFELSVTVRNQGLSAGGRLLPPLTVLRYYRRSTNSRITRVGTDRVGLLPARGLPFSSTGEDIDLTAPRRAGTYYYSACIDSVTNESDTTNNCSAAVRVDVPSNPDLIVEDASVDDSTLSPGGSFRLSVTVRNQGNEQSGRTTLRYYRSSDSGISARYTQVGTDSVSGLSADRTDNESIDLTAPDSVGTYYYGACIDSVTNESDTNNNCSAAVSLRVTRPDLIVEDVSVDNSTLSSGDSFELSVTVRNQGPSAGGRLLSPLTVLRYYRSTDLRITTGDTQVGTDSVSRLSAGRTDDKSIDLTAPNSVGTYYYGACIDSVTNESDTNNNCSTAVSLVVNAPDLIVEGASVDDSTPSPEGSFELSVTVRNQGSSAGGSFFSLGTVLRYYRSTNSRITTGDTQVGTDRVGLLPASGLPLSSTGEDIDLTAPSRAGTYYYGACIDSVTNESDTTNNCSPAVRVDVPSNPDLIVEDVGVNDSTPSPGGDFRLSVTVRNQGNEQSGRTTLRYYRSTNSRITTGDTRVGTDSVSRLSAGRTDDKSIDLTAPDSLGTYYYGACIDSVTNESDTNNNCSAAVRVDVIAPDLIVEDVSVDPSTLAPGGSFELSVTVRNQGSSATGGLFSLFTTTDLRYYRSNDSRITTGDTQVGTDRVGLLPASWLPFSSTGEDIDLTAPSRAGTYYYGACIDSVTNESDTNNNCSAAVRLRATRSDLVVEGASVNDSTPSPGGSFRLSVTVRNQGNEQSGRTTLRYYRSSDSSISARDTQVGTDSVSGLSAGRTDDESIDLTAPDSVGTYYYGACIDSVTDESDTNNNCSAAVRVDVIAPDLIVEDVSVDPSTLAPGGSFELSVTVRNQGSSAGGRLFSPFNGAAVLPLNHFNHYNRRHPNRHGYRRPVACPWAAVVIHRRAYRSHSPQLCRNLLLRRLCRQRHE